MKKFFYFIAIIAVLLTFSCKDAPSEPVSYTVTGSSGDSWNATYVLDGTENGKPRYTGVRGSWVLKLYWNATRTNWEITASGSAPEYDYRHLTASDDLPPTDNNWVDFNDDPFTALTLTANY